MSRCNHCGISSDTLKKAAYATTIANVPARKLRCRNSFRSTIGSLSVNSQIRNTASATTATQASTTILVEANQSSSLPRSSTSCSAPTPITSVIRPT